MNDIVRAIPGFPGYFADTEGGIWSTLRGRWGSRYSEFHELKTKPDKDGYGCVRLWLTSQRKTTNQRVHVLVARAFLGPKPASLVVCHRDGNNQNNAAVNLMYATHAENIRQAIEQGTRVCGERSHLSKLTEEQVREIKRRLQAGESQRSLAREFSVVVSTIWEIKTGRTWRHLAVADSA